MRDPQGNEASYSRFFRIAAAVDEGTTPFEQVDLDIQMARAEMAYREADNFIRHRYGYGAGLDEIAAWMRGTLPRLEKLIKFHWEHAASHYGEPQVQPFRPIRAIDRRAYAFVAMTVLLVEQSEHLAAMEQLVSRVPDQRTRLFDLLLHAFIPDHEVATDYPTNLHSAAYSEPVLQAIRAAPDQRADLLAKHMQQWPKLMRPYGWKPDLKPAPGGDSLFCDFAFEVALAVCAYDIDDSSFADHPYYPRDLADFYRARLRMTRDAWRAPTLGAGLPIPAAPAPAMADLAKSKRKGVGRWIELVCDGDSAAVEAVLASIGKPRKIAGQGELLEAISGQGHAVLADLKDDETVEACLQHIADKRGIAVFDASAHAGAGAGRCEALLALFGTIASDKGYHLLDLDPRGDSWSAVLVREAYLAEFMPLSTQIGIECASWTEGHAR